MEEIIDLQSELNKGETYFDNKIIRCNSKNVISNDIVVLSFHNCVFENYTSFQSRDKDFKLRIFFYNCRFKKHIIFDIYKVSLIQFSDIQDIVSVSIRGWRSEIQSLNFDNFTLNKGIVEISVYKLKELLCLDSHIRTFKISTISKDIPTRFCLENLGTFNLLISGIYISPIDITSFSNIAIENNLILSNCKLDKVYFNQSLFGIAVSFIECEFISLVSFKDCSKSIYTNFFITSCLFKDSCYFNNSKFDFLHIKDTTFEKKVSFENVTVNAVNLSQVIFLGGAYFDEFKITNPFNNTQTTIEEKKRTYRTIKQELQKLDNRIDYNTFRVYELTMHSQEVNELLRDSKLPESEKDTLLKDKCILYLHHYVSNFGTDWRKALSFILCTGFTFYTILYMIENANKELDICAGLHGYINGFFKYILVTNFDNPLLAGEVIKEEVFKFTYIPSYFVFIFGKILIAFGIYEMVQSFRKFRY